MCSLSVQDLSTRSHDELVTHIVELRQQLELYKFKLEEIREFVYGKRSEKRRAEFPGQGNLFDEPKSSPDSSQESVTEQQIPAHTRKRPSKKIIPDDLPVETEVFYPAESDCVDCQQACRELSRDVREEIEHIPARFFKRRYETVHTVCPQCSRIYSGSTPQGKNPVIPGSQVGPGFLSHISTSKYCDHIPYYRQSQIYQRAGIFMPDKTLSRYGLAIGELLEPVAKAIKAEILTQPYVQGDETRLHVLDSSREGNIHKGGYVWALASPLCSLVYFEYHNTRGHNRDGVTLFL